MIKHIKVLNEQKDESLPMPACTDDWCAYVNVGDCDNWDWCSFDFASDCATSDSCGIDIS